MTKPEKPDPDTAAMIDTAVRRHGWRKLVRETDPLGPPERIEDYAETGLAIDAMNRERLALRAKWAEEERQRKAEDAAAKAEEERRFWLRLHGDFSEEPEPKGCAYPEPEKGETDPELRRAQRFVDEHSHGQGGPGGSTKR